MLPLRELIFDDRTNAVDSQAPKALHDELPEHGVGTKAHTCDLCLPSVCRKTDQRVSIAVAGEALLAIVVLMKR